MVTRAILDNLPPPASVQEVSTLTLRDAIIAALQGEFPTWTPAPDDPAYKLAETLAYVLFIGQQQANAAIRDSLLAYAAGSNLDHLAALVNIVRLEGESDDTLRLRIPAAFLALSVGTEPGYLNTVLSFQDTPLIDAQLTVAANGQDITIYALKAGRTQLTNDEQAALQAWMRLPANHHIGDVMTVAAPTITPYTVSMTVNYDASQIDAETLEALLRNFIYGYIERTSRLGEAVNTEVLFGQVAQVPAVESFTGTSPAQDLPAAVGTIYTCPTTTAGVTINLVAVTT